MVIAPANIREAGVLDRIIAGVRSDLGRRRQVTGENELHARIADRPPARDARAALAATDNVRVIAEVKRKSPSKGELALIGEPGELARTYQSGGAAAVSVLTEGRRFSGSFADLDTVRDAVDIPVLEKDFVVSDYQVIEARAHGADIVLLIVAALADDELLRLRELAESLGMTALVETHTADEVDRAVAAGADVIGVNNRNLKTLEVRPGTFGELAPDVPAHCLLIGESGVRDVADVESFAAAGADAVLVGEALVTGGTPSAAVADFSAVRKKRT